MGIKEEYDQAIEALVSEEDKHAYGVACPELRLALARLRVQEFLARTGAGRSTAWRRVKAALAGDTYGENWGGARR